MIYSVTIIYTSGSAQPWYATTKDGSFQAVGLTMQEVLDDIAGQMANKAALAGDSSNVQFQLVIG